MYAVREAEIKYPATTVSRIQISTDDFIGWYSWPHNVTHTKYQLCIKQH